MLNQPLVSERFADVEQILLLSQRHSLPMAAGALRGLSPADFRSKEIVREFYFTVGLTYLLKWVFFLFQHDPRSEEDSNRHGRARLLHHERLELQVEEL